jgi:hypothetical protein
MVESRFVCYQGPLARIYQFASAPSAFLALHCLDRRYQPPLPYSDPARRLIAESWKGWVYYAFQYKACRWAFGKGVGS